MSDAPTLAARARGQVNRVVLLVALVVALPGTAIVERVRAGAGRRFVVRAILLVGRVLGVRFATTSDPAVTGAPSVLVPNHRSPIDIPALLVARPTVRFVAAAELFRIPLLRATMRALDCVPVDRANPVQAQAELEELVADGRGDMVVFAEGGIVRGDLGPFRSGAFRVAIATGMPVVPVAIHGSEAVLGAGRRLKVLPGTITVDLGAPIPTEGLRREDRRGLRDRTHAAVQAALAARP